MVRCSHCKLLLAETQFPPSALAKGDYRCLACFRAKNKKLRESNPGKARKGARDRMRQWRERNPGVKSTEAPESVRARASRYAKEHPEVKRAHNMVQRALKDGRLTKKPCEECGSTRVQAHHEDYSKPLQVRWLCPKHHNREHKWLS